MAVNPCFAGDDNVLDRQKFASTLQKGNYLNFNKPVHVQLGNLITGPDGNTVVELDAYGIHLVDADENTIVCPIPLTKDWLAALGFKLRGKNKKQACIDLITSDPENRIYELMLTEKTPFSWYADLFDNDGIRIGLTDQLWVHQLQNFFAALSPGHFLTLQK